MRLLYATHSRGKLAELARLAPALARDARLLGDVGISDVAPEEGATFLENAVAKARYYGERAGMAALADDSGLCIDALLGAPGVHTARYLPELTQEERNARLAATIGRRPEGERGASFVCVLALYRPDAELLAATGEVRGEIAPDARGSGGFGYDPVFLVPSLGRTFAELAGEEKDRWSHRGRALRALLEELGRTE